MDIRHLTPELSVGPQIGVADIADLRRRGFRAVVGNRPDGESGDAPTWEEIRAAAEATGLAARQIPVLSGRVTDADAEAFARALSELPKPVFAFCRSGTRSSTLWALSEARRRPLPEILGTAKAAGYDLSGVARRVAAGGRTPTDRPEATYDVVVVGGGAAGVAVAASLLARDRSLDVAIVDPADVHYYQPGWTLVGAGVFEARDTERTMGSLIPRGAKWIKAAVAAFEPEADAVILDGCRVIGYRRLIVCPGIKLDWDAVEGLPQTLGRNGVTSNYRYDLAPYTWELVRDMKAGRALFSQPAMPIKCAGAPQKAMYLSGDHWLRTGRIRDIDVEFMNAGGVLFGVRDYVPALEQYVARYGAKVNFHHDLVAIDGPSRTAVFEVRMPGAEPRRIEERFDMIHVCPPQTAPDFVRVSPLADAAGWVDVDQATLQHRSYANVWSLGDVMNAPNAKTAAAARKQAPVVAENVIADIRGRSPVAQYDGYGSCPLTVERGKIVLAEFGYGGALLPSFPRWLIDGTRPSRAAWLLKEKMLPPVYWQAMLKGREWMARPGRLTRPTMAAD